jgi:hypothetical protein
MKVTIESTTKIVELNNVPARVWEGQTEDGIAVHCYITRISVESEGDTEQFERELQECKAPSAEIEAIPLRMIL